MDKVSKVYCVVDPISETQCLEDLIKTSSVKRFAWWTTTPSGKSGILQHGLTAFTTKKDALAEASSRSNAFKAANKLIREANDISDKAISGEDVAKNWPLDPTGCTQVKGANDRPNEPEDKSWKFETPASILKSLRDKIKQMEDLLDAELAKEPNHGTFYLTAIGALTELLSYMEAGTQRDFKLAVLKFYSFANFIYLEVPLDVTKFLSGGGGFPRLKDYYYKEVNKTAPKQGPLEVDNKDQIKK